MKKLCILSIICTMLLTSCSNDSTVDYELRLVENNNKYTLNNPDMVFTSYVVDLSEEVPFKNNNIDENINSDITETQDETIETPDEIQEDTQEVSVETSDDIEVDESPVESVEEELPQEEVVVPQEEVVAPQEEVVAPQEEVIAPQEEVIAPQEEVIAPQEEVVAPQEEKPTTDFIFETIYDNYQCVHLEEEHIFTNTLINYVGAGNFAKWVATDKPRCEQGLSIYDYMDYFNMTKNFFNNLTANDPTYANVDVDAYGDFIH